MSAKIPYSSPQIVMKASSKRVTAQSSESLELHTQQKFLMEANYQKDSEIPQNPSESKSLQFLTVASSDVPCIPPLKPGSAPRKVFLQETYEESKLGSYDPAMLLYAYNPHIGGMRRHIIYNPMTNKPLNFRTLPCKHFHSVAGCNRGESCHFIHDFQHAGKPIPNFHHWKNTNPIRLANLQAMNSSMSLPCYYPPPPYN